MNRHNFLEKLEQSPIVRWAAFRERADGSYVDLPQDGSLIEQYEGLKCWVRQVAAKESLAESFCDDLALAYAVRQVDHGNVMLNWQNVDTRAAEAARLDTYADQIRDSDLQQAFRAVAEALTGGNKETARLLEAANALFYLETGTKAAVAAQDHTQEEDRTMLFRLAANAVGNNLEKAKALVKMDLVNQALLPVSAHRETRSIWDKISDKESYLMSRGYLESRKDPSAAPQL